MSDGVPTGERFARLEVQVEGISKSMHDLRNLLMGANAPTEIKLLNVEKQFNSRLDAIEKGQDAVKLVVDKMSTKLEERSKFPFATVFTFCGLMLAVGGGIGGYVVGDIRGDITEIKRDHVARAELDNRARLAEAARLEIARRVEALERKTK